MYTATRKLRVFICHSSQDKSTVRELYQRFLAEGWIDAWLDEEKLLPGQDWNLEIEKAVETSDAVIVCLSNNSVSKEGYAQRELRFVFDIALEKPEGTIFIIPLRLDSYVPPRSLKAWHYADYFPVSNRDISFARLLVSLENRALALSIGLQKGSKPTQNNYRTVNDAWKYFDEGINLFKKHNFHEATTFFDECIKILRDYVPNYFDMDVQICAGRIIRELCDITSSGLNDNRLHFDSKQKITYLIMFLARYAGTKYGRDLYKVNDLLEAKQENYSSSDIFQIKQLLKTITDEYGYIK